MDLIDAKQILSHWSKGENWFGMNYNMNLYKGCSHGCIYCDSRSDCYQIKNFDSVRAKANALEILEKELKSKRKKGVISFGAMNDPYNPYEKEQKLTRGALKLINKYGFGVGMLTKSNLILRDIDLYKEIKKHSSVMVKLTITTFDDNLCKVIEPHVSPSSVRFSVLKELSDAGFYTGVMLWPLLPFINDNVDNVKLIVEQAANSGAHFVAPYLGVTLRQNQRFYFYKQLDLKFPGIKEKYINHFGTNYECISPNYYDLKMTLEEECKKYGLLYKMTDIRKEFIRQSTRQLSLFDL